VILTSNKTPKTAEARLQKATNTVSRWANKNGFTISTEKTKTEENLELFKPKMKIRIGTEKIAMGKHHRILRLFIDERINWNKYIQKTLLNNETTYGSASKAVLRKLYSIHHRGVRLGFGTFAKCKTEN
jgi:hypothetical protein